MENVLSSYVVSLGFKIRGSEFAAAEKLISAFGKNVFAVSNNAAGSIGKVADGLGGKLSKAIEQQRQKLEQIQKQGQQMAAGGIPNQRP